MGILIVLSDLNWVTAGSTTNIIEFHFALDFSGVFFGFFSSKMRRCFDTEFDYFSDIVLLQSADIDIRKRK